MRMLKTVTVVVLGIQTLFNIGCGSGNSNSVDKDKANGATQNEINLQTPEGQPPNTPVPAKAAQNGTWDVIKGTYEGVVLIDHSDENEPRREPFRFAIFDQTQTVSGKEVRYAG